MAATETSKQPRVVFQALSTQCPRMIATVNIPANDGAGPVAKVKEMDRLGRFIVEKEELHYDLHVAALRRFCERKPTLLFELGEGKKLPADFAFAPPSKAVEMDTLQETRRVAAERTDQLNQATKTIENKDAEITELRARLAKLEAARK